MTEGFVRTMSVYDADPNFLREPKTKFYCAICQKDMNPAKPYREVHLIEGGVTILHAGDEALYETNAADTGLFPVGLDCAKKIGLEWTSVPDRLEEEDKERLEEALTQVTGD